jgi:hypothetical protein
MGDNRIGSVDQERHNLQELEVPFRKATLENPHSADAVKARQALQAEVDKINNSAALRDPNVRADFIGRVAGIVDADDIAALGPDKKVHLATVKEDRPGHLAILPDTKISADEDRVKANLKLGLHPYLDATQTTHFLHTHHRPEKAIQDYDKAVFGLPAETGADALQNYENESSQLRRAAFNLYAARAGLKGYNVETASSAMSALLRKVNAEGPDHVNHLARGMNFIYTDCLKNENGKLMLKPEADLANWQKSMSSSGETEYDIKGK